MPAIGVHSRPTPTEICACMNISRHIEFDISYQDHRHITQLRNLSFPDSAVPRSYCKQLPHFRYLVHEHGNLVAHPGVDHRMILVGERAVHIFGVIDLCVDPLFRRKGIATTLTNLARRGDRFVGLYVLRLRPAGFRPYWVTFSFCFCCACHRAA